MDKYGYCYKLDNFRKRNGCLDIQIAESYGKPRVKITLSGGALAKNIFWQVAGTVNIGTAQFKGCNIVPDRGYTCYGTTLTGLSTNRCYS
jgi:hypothetical protein